MKFPAWMAAVVAALVLLMGSMFVVSEGQTAIVLNLGRVARVNLQPGLHFKWPLMESGLIVACRCCRPSPSAT